MKKILLITSLLFGFSSFAIVDTIQIGNGGSNYSPNSLTIDLGDTVRFLLIGGANIHPTESDNGMWSTFTLSAVGQTQDILLTSAGNYPYHCQFHGSTGGGGMSGTIIVVDTATAPTTSISSQPINDTVIEGSSAEFIISTANEDSLQWQEDTGSGFSNISGATSSTLNIANTTLSMNGNQYRCLVFGNPDLTSDTVSLKVDSLPSTNDNVTIILVQNDEYVPSSVNVEINDTIRFKWVEGVHPTESVTGDWQTFTLSDTNQTIDFTFPSEGVYNYFCQFHGFSDGTGMFGRIIVGNPVIDNIDENIQKIFMVSPNPTSGQINVIHNYDNLSSIEIISISGKVVKSISWNSISTINISNLPNGIYFIKGFDNHKNELLTEKLIKK